MEKPESLKLIWVSIISIVITQKQLLLFLDQLLLVQQCKWWQKYIYRKLISKPIKSVPGLSIIEALHATLVIMCTYL